MPDILQTLLASLLGGGFLAFVCGKLLTGWTARVEGKIQHGFDRQLKVFESEVDWLESALSEAIGPAAMHLRRTREVGERYATDTFAKVGASYADACLLRESNALVRQVLLSKAHLLSNALFRDAATLVAHYDEWEKRFDRKLAEVRARNEQPEQVVFDVGFGTDFPKGSVQAFLDEFETLRKRLYGIARPA